MKKLFILILLGFLLVGSTTSVFASKTEEDVIDESIEYNVDDNTEENNYKEYFTIMSKMEETRLDEDKLYYQFYFDNELKYDYLKVFCISSSNVFLNDYQTIKLDYKETCNSIDLKFELNSDKIDIDEIPLYSEIKYDELCITAYAYLNDEVVDTQTQGLYLINSIHGIFVSEFSSFYTYDNYIGYLYSNSLIKEERYKLIAKKITELTPVDEEEKYTKKEELKLFRYFDEDIFEIQEVEVESISDIADKINHHNKCYSPIIPGNDTTYDGPNISIGRTITAKNNGRKLEINGYVNWSDINGTYHPARHIKVQIMDEGSTDKVISTVYTNNNGYFYSSFNNDLSSKENGYDIYIKVVTTDTNFNVGSGNKSSLFNKEYYLTTKTDNNVRTQKYFKEYRYEDGIDCDDTIEAVKAISIHQALNVGYYYFDQMNNHDIDSVKVVYPTIESDVEDGHKSYYTQWGNKISIYCNDYCDWDVILHELGHKVAHYIGVDAYFAKQHYRGENLSERYGKRLGIQGAWNEGWATYFGLSSQLYYDSNVLDISDIPYVADYIYTDYKPEKGEAWWDDYLTDLGLSEGNEEAVTAVLLQLFIDNKIGLTHQEIWNYVKASQCDNFSEFYQYLKSTLNSYEKISAIGSHLEEQEIVDTPKVNASKTKSIFYRSNPGQFYWHAAKTKDDKDGVDSKGNNFNAHEYLNQCKIEFFDKDYNRIPLNLSYIASTDETCTIDTTNWSILSQYVSNGDYFYWCISTRQNDTPSTGPYLSSFHKAYFSEDITTISNLNTQYSGYINSGKEKLYKYNVLEDGNYIFSSTGSTDVNVTIYDRPIIKDKEINDDDSGSGLNFLYENSYEAGTTLYIMVKGYDDSTSGSFNIIVTKCEELVENSLNSATISGKKGIWFKFKAPEQNYYTFYSTGSIDTYGELFYFPTYESNYNRVTYNNDSGEGRNFLFTYFLYKDQEIYIRVTAYNRSVSGNCNLCVVPTPVVNSLNTTYNDTLVINGYTIYKFTAPNSGYYDFYTTGSINTYIDIFDYPVLTVTNKVGSKKSDDDSGSSYNALISSYWLNKNQTIFIRVRGCHIITCGRYGFVVELSK